MKRIIGCLAVGFLLVGCSKEGSSTGTSPSAETSVHVDLEDTKDSLKKTLNEAGSKIESGAKKAEAKLEEAGDKLKEKYDDAKDKLDDDKKIKIEVKKD